MKVSIVITCYNYAKYIEKCLDSVLAQSFRDYEVIVVNDGSTDESEEKILRYTERKNFRYVYQGNSGQACAKNTGIRNARGELIAFLDADDLWEPLKLERQVPCFDDPDVGVVYSRARYIDENGMDVSLEMSGPCFDTHSGYVLKPLFIDNFVPFSSSMVHTKCLSEFGGFDQSLQMGIDWDLWLRISRKYKFIGIKEPLLVYRVGHPGQMSKNLEIRQNCSDRIINRFIENYPESLDKETIRAALVHTFINRGNYHRGGSLMDSSTYFLKALKLNPMSVKPYKGLARNLLLYFERNLSFKRSADL